MKPRAAALLCAAALLLAGCETLTPAQRRDYARLRAAAERAATDCPP